MIRLAPLAVLAVALGCRLGPPYSVSGTATYGWVPARDSAEGGVRLDYTAVQARPIRRAVVQAVDGDGSQLGSSITADDGSFTLTEKGKTEKVKLHTATDLGLGAHVGHTVRLTGEWKEDGGAKVFHVSKMEHVSPSCS